MMVSVRAPAKVNLCLHITGQRDNGYHEIDSIVSFGAAHDLVKAERDSKLSISVEGPESAGVPCDSSNLILKAAEILADGGGASFTLIKNLPTASGIGGGSSDAAAAVKALRLLGDRYLTRNSKGSESPFSLDGLVQLGADIPMCLAARPLRAQGLGDRLTEIFGMPDLPVVLANPRIPVSTPVVFQHLKNRTNAPLPVGLPRWSDLTGFCEWLNGTRNDLEGPAFDLHPEIAVVRDALRMTEGALIARMSGSGSTCFAVFGSIAAAKAVQSKLNVDHPNWWTACGWLGDCSKDLVS